MRPQEIANELEEKRDEMLIILDEMFALVDRSDNIAHIASRAQAYWYPQIKMVLTKESGYLGGSMCDVDDTINELREEGPY